jgi:hypothetical protein
MNQDLTQLNIQRGFERIATLSLTLQAGDETANEAAANLVAQWVAGATGSASVRQAIEALALLDLLRRLALNFGALGE